MIILQPAAGSTFAPGDPIAVAGTATDAVGVTSVTVSLGGGAPQTAALNGSNWTATVTAAGNGQLPIVALARDAAGNTGSATVTVTVQESGTGDTTAPTVAITSPTFAQNIVAGETVTVSGTATDNVAVTGVSVAFADGTPVPATLSGSSWSANVTATGLGTRTITAAARDAAGNIGNATVSVNVVEESGPDPDEIDPVVTIASPSGASEFIAGSIVSVSGTATDNVGVTGVSVNYAGGAPVAASRVGDTWSAEVMATGLGDRTITAIASDEAGNTGSATVTISVVADPDPDPDDTDPVVTITEPTNGTEVTQGSSIEVRGSASDDTAVTNLTVRMEGGPEVDATLTGTDWVANLVVTGEGPRTITATASDAVGNTASATVTVNVVIEPEPDVTDPVIAITSPTEDAEVTTGVPVHVSGTASDNVAVTGVSVAFADGTPVAATLTGNTWTAEVTATGTGPRTITAVASDAAGNTATASVSVNAVDDSEPEPDETDPVVTITSPTANAEFTLNSNINVVATATDNVGVTGVTVTLEGDTPVAAIQNGSTWSAAVTADAIGPYTITVVASDAAGNTGSDSVTIDVIEPFSDVEGTLERVPAVGSGKPIPLSVTDFQASGLAADLLDGDASGSAARFNLPPPNRLLVTFAPRSMILSAGVSVTDMQQLQTTVAAIASDYSTLGVTSASSLLPTQGVGVVQLVPGADVSATMAALQADPRIARVERDYWVYALLNPQALAFQHQWAHDIADAQVAWATETGSDAVRVAVIDTGSAAPMEAESTTGTHPDLVANLIPGYDFVSGIDLEEDVEGPLPVFYQNLKALYPNVQYLDGDADRGWDPYPVDEMNTVFDGETGTIVGVENVGSHGTHVAGIIGASPGPEAGVAGVVWDVEIQPLRALGHVGFGSGSDILAAVAYAAGLTVANPAPGEPPLNNPTPADIINMSLGGPSHSDIAQGLYTDVRDLGVLVVAAAGNDSSSAPFYPASYDGVVSVSSLDYIRWVEERGGPALAFSDLFSNYGSFIDISAPGGVGWLDVAAYDTENTGRLIPNAHFILSAGWWWFHEGTKLNAPTLYHSPGTSMASPYVAGAAALLLSLDPNLTADDLEEILTSTASRVDDSFLASPRGQPEQDRDDYYGYGAVNLAAAVEAVQSGTWQRIPSLTYVEARNTLDPTQAVRTTAAADLSYTFYNLPDGSWNISAGTDANGNGNLGESGEYYGTAPAPVTVTGGSASGAVDFTLQRQP